MINQCRKPTGWLGRFVLWSMNSSHSKVTDWGLGPLRPAIVTTLFMTVSRIGLTLASKCCFEFVDEISQGDGIDPNSMFANMGGYE